MLDYLTAAFRYLRGGLSILPCLWAAKCPAGWLLPRNDAGRPTWNPYRERRATPGEVLRWFTGRRADALAIVTGRISGGLEVLDFDAPEYFPRWLARVGPLAERLPVVRSRSGGFHVYYRCAATAGNQKLATDPQRPKPTLIETRGEGGYIIAPPSRGYTSLQGDLGAVPTLTPTERDPLLAAARSFDRTPVAPPPASRRPARPPAPALRPGDDFNQRGDIQALLTSAGWTLVRLSHGEEYWRRPGKRGRGWSATFLPDAQCGGWFYVFSTNAAPFAPQQPYSPFAVYTLLHHGGNYVAAARALAAQGYGRAR